MAGTNAWWRKKVIAVTHGFYRRRQARRLTIRECSILSIDCVGGVMAHDLRLRFGSPTVNLFFDSVEDFLCYVEGIRYYAEAELSLLEMRSGGREFYPLARLVGDDRHPDLKIHFLHYPDFEQARAKWIERSRRIDFGNLCVVMQAAELDARQLERFERLPVARKVILTYRTLPLESPSIFKMHSLDRFVPGRILDYNGLSGRRYLDDFDYVAFLNDGSIRSNE